MPSQFLHISLPGVVLWGIASILSLSGVYVSNFDVRRTSLHSDVGLDDADRASRQATPQPVHSKVYGDSLLVDYTDFIYHWGEWDASPVVIEEYRLVFFTSAKVGCTIWKQLFRRMMGAEDWKVEMSVHLLPWNPQANGLKYLYDYDRATATKIMTSPYWTRAIFVRDSKERFLSAYLDKAFHPTFLRSSCCVYNGDCIEPARESAQGFFELIKKCDNPHWRPQALRMEDKFWPYINYVGHMETVAEDAERLLKQIGAWEKHGVNGWGDDGSLAVFQTRPGGVGRKHATNARDKLRSYISPELEKQLDDFYRKDYESPYMNITKFRLY